MIHSEKILHAVAKIVSLNETATFTREEIRVQAGVNREDWNAGYSPIFQGMRAEQPGGASPVPPRFKNVFRQVESWKTYSNGIWARCNQKT